MLNYPWDVEAKPPGESLDPIFFDRYHGHIVARPEWTDINDHVAVVHILERPRSSVHYAGPYPHYRLHANGELVLSSPAPEAAGITNPSGLTGGRTVAYEDLGGGSFIHGADLSMRFTPANNKAERQVGIDFTEPEAKISRYNATIFVDDQTTLYAVLDIEADGKHVRSKFLNGDSVQIDGTSFSISGGAAAMHGTVIAADPASPLALDLSRARLSEEIEAAVVAERQAAVKARAEALAAAQAAAGIQTKAKKKKKGGKGKRKKALPIGLSVASLGGHLMVLTTGDDKPVADERGITVNGYRFHLVDGALAVEQPEP